MNYTEIAKQVIEKVKYIAVATCNKEGQPWNTPVYAAYDENYNFYWTSYKGNQHSINIRDNSKIFIVIYDSTGGIGNKTGVYIQAEAYELSELEDIRTARSYTQGRKGKEVDDPRKFVGDQPRRVYIAKPQKVWVNDATITESKLEEAEFIRDYRIEIKL
jgi:uncharacterized protein YhbP (UPF0306 family)